MHRVQRVPATEANGRVHTSAASVVVLPEVEDVEVNIDPGDLRIDVYRSGGAGGQTLIKLKQQYALHIFRQDWLFNVRMSARN